MRELFTVLRYEYKMQCSRLTTWGVLLAATALSLLDNFPSAGNLTRLEFLKEPAYYVYRIVSLDGLVLLFGLLFLLAGRIPLDARTGMRALLMSSPLQKWQYMWGKLSGGFLYIFTLQCVFLVLNTAIYFAAAPFALSPAACIVPLAKAIVVSCIPASVCVGFCSVALPGVMDLRLFYLLAALYFGWNAAYVGSAETMPFYLLTSGDLARLIWVHPRWPSVPLESVLANGIFLTGVGLAAACLLLGDRKVWMPE